MQPNSVNDNALLSITAKELGQFFRAPIAWLFLAVFLLVSLFIFFWVESFFARNIADIRPLFEWMPLLLIFLSSALTMKMWSEERRSGTLEYVLTQPVPLWQFVVGKFFACWLLLAIALLLTLPVPITISFLGQVDWGPVVSGYVASFLLGGAYLSMGLFISARCDNQIVSLILSVLLASAFYLIGASTLTQLVGNNTAEILRSVGTGSRFESITRGVLDFRDLYYYGSVMMAFIALNILSLESGRWASDGDRGHHRMWRLGIGFLVANAVAANLWLGQINSLRVDTTRGNIYSISDSTRNFLAQLQEPLLIRGYFSQKTHPLLSPLVPQMQDLLREYEIAGDGRVKVEIVDPTADPKIEDSANRDYNINPTPFRVNDRHQASLVNSYFDILIKYGDEYQVLSFGDLIEVKAADADDVDVRLRNPEYDVTHALKKVLFTYQSGGSVFDAVKDPVKMTAYISADNVLPAELVQLKEAVQTEAKRLKVKAEGKFDFEIVDPEARGGAVAKQIGEEYGIAPMAAGLMDPTRFYFNLVLSQGDQVLQVGLDDFSEATFRKNLRSGIKRFAQGFMRTVALVAPEQPDEFTSHYQDRKPTFSGLKQYLSQDMKVIDEDLSDGRVDSEADILVLAMPELQSEVEHFAIDQFLMKGGTVIASTSRFSAKIKRDSIRMENIPSGINGWLDDMGIKIDGKIVMDEQNAAFPVPTVREVNGLRFQDMHMLDYPYFVDVRTSGLNEEAPITADMPQITVPWASPITVDEEKTKNLKVLPLLHSTENAWLDDGSQVMPSQQQVMNGFNISGDQGRYLLAVALQGEFKSSFAGKDSPIIDQKGDEENADEPASNLNMVIEKSASSARLVVFASNDIFRDTVINMLGAVQGGTYLNSLQMAANTVDWALEDQSLSSIRSRGHFNRTLIPMDDGAQEFWEYLNYGLVLALLAIIWFISHYISRIRHQRYQQILAA